MTISQKKNSSLDNMEEVLQYNVHDLPYVKLIGHFKAKFIPDIYLFYKIVTASSERELLELPFRAFQEKHGWFHFVKRLSNKPFNLIKVGKIKKHIHRIPVEIITLQKFGEDVVNAWKNHPFFSFLGSLKHNWFKSAQIFENLFNQSFTFFSLGNKIQFEKFHPNRKNLPASKKQISLMKIISSTKSKTSNCLRIELGFYNEKDERYIEKEIFKDLVIYKREIKYNCHFCQNIGIEVNFQINFSEREFSINVKYNKDFKKADSPEDYISSTNLLITIDRKENLLKNLDKIIKKTSNKQKTREKLVSKIKKERLDDKTKTEQTENQVKKQQKEKQEIRINSKSKRSYMIVNELKIQNQTDKTQPQKRTITKSQKTNRNQFESNRRHQQKVALFNSQKKERQDKLREIWDNEWNQIFYEYLNRNIDKINEKEVGIKLKKIKTDYLDSRPDNDLTYILDFGREFNAFLNQNYIEKKLRIEHKLSEEIHLKTKEKSISEIYKLQIDIVKKTDSRPLNESSKEFVKDFYLRCIFFVFSTIFLIFLCTLVIFLFRNAQYGDVIIFGIIILVVILIAGNYYAFFLRKYE